MTSYILLKKLASTKLDKKSIIKVKNNINKILLKQHNTASALNKLLKKERERKLCRLCLKTAEHWLFEKGNDINIIDNMQYVLGIQVAEQDSKPQHICSSCLDDLNVAVKLKSTAEATQWRLQQEIELVSEIEQVDLHSDSNMYTSPNAGYFTRQSNKPVKREWKCTKCRTKFTVADDFVSHRTSKLCQVRPDRVCICEICGRKCKSKRIYVMHRSTHQPELRHACPECPYRTRLPASLAAHLRTHTGERPVRCPHCPMTFARPSNLASHRRRHFPPRHRCPTCDKAFNNKQSMEMHITSQHSNLKPHVCSACGKAFSTRRLLRTHELKIHKCAKRRGGSIPTYILLKQGDDADRESARLTFTQELGLV